MKKNFRKGLIRSLHGGNFFSCGGFLIFAPYDSRVLEWKSS